MAYRSFREVLAGSTPASIRRLQSIIITPNSRLAHASGVEIEQPDGAGQFESVTLRPHAKLAAGSDENSARRLRDAAAEKCFVARSVTFRVEHEPTFEIASA